ncbi:MAG TPA: acyl-CoA dehydrogenase family protein [Acidimicrobiales bacterium]|nr:acyl-CoA dehydrogenase family protein [Acidimicrobiales bacterium]
MEDVGAFRRRASQWLADTMPRLPEGVENFQLVQEDEMGERARRLQRTLFDGGFAGICYPVEYGGQGLTRAHQQAFTQESYGYQMPTLFNVPTLSILAPTLLDFGTVEQKLRHLPAILGGEELWVQFLSEPSGGSDLAGLVTQATRDGDVFIMNGSKIWSSGAFRSDYAMCLVRTDPHVPKHQGLTMLIVKIHQPGIEVQRIKMVNGTAEFCQEFFDDVAIPVDDVVGGINDGWTVASRLLIHEREAVGGGSPYVSGVAVGTAGEGGQRTDLADLARATGQAHDPVVRQLVAEARVNDRVQQQLIERVTTGIRTGAFPAPAGAVPRLYAATNNERHYDIGLEIAGADAGAWADDDPGGVWGEFYLSRQANSLGGGSNEMQRNIISERVLGMPREFAADRDKPFDEVRHNRSPQRSS